MAEEGDGSIEGSNSPSQIRRGARSEGYLLKLDKALYGSKSPRDAMRTRSYSTNDSDDLEERLQNTDQGGSRRFSITDMLLGQRSYYSRNESVITQTVEEVSDSMENLGEETIVMSSGISLIGQTEGVQQTDGNETSAVKNTTKPDQLNSHLLDTFLSRLGSITGIGSPGAVYKGRDERENSGEYNTVYSDDFLMDRICRRMSKKKEKS